jgi:hypothetical protein
MSQTVGLGTISRQGSADQLPLGLRQQGVLRVQDRLLSNQALAICTKPAPRVAGRVVDFWQDKLHVAHRNHDPSAQVGKKLLQCTESP